MMEACRETRRMEKLLHPEAHAKSANSKPVTHRWHRNPDHVNLKTESTNMKTPDSVDPKSPPAKLQNPTLTTQKPTLSDAQTYEEWLALNLGPRQACKNWLKKTENWDKRGLARRICPRSNLGQRVKMLEDENLTRLRDANPAFLNQYLLDPTKPRDTTGTSTTNLRTAVGASGKPPTTRYKPKFDPTVRYKQVYGPEGRPTSKNPGNRDQRADTTTTTDPRTTVGMPIPSVLPTTGQRTVGSDAPGEVVERPAWDVSGGN